MKAIHISIIILCFSILAQGQVAERIVTAGSAITETVCALGDCDKIVGADRTSLYPAKIQQRPSIGYRSGISAEGILSLGPTLVIAEKSYVDDAVLQQLAGSPVKLIVVDRSFTLEGTKKLIHQIGVTLKREKEAQELISGIERDITELRSLLEGKKSLPTVACIYNRGASTVSAGGSDTFAEILQYVGARNAFSGIAGYKPLNTEALISANPDYLLMVSTGFESLGGMEGVLKIPGVALTTAGREKKIIVVESLKLTNFGPRLGEAVREVVLQLHPELASK